MLALQRIDPATGACIGESPVADQVLVATALSRARMAQPAWAGRPWEERRDTIIRFRDLVSAQCEPLAALLTTDMGKPRTQAIAEVARVGERIDYFLSSVPAVTDERLVASAGGTVERLAYEPLGVVGCISAWNYPWFVGMNVIIPALLTGNAVLYKPSEHAVASGLAMDRLLHQAGVPEDGFITLVGGRETGMALSASALDGLFFTGSNRAGAEVARTVASRLGRVQLELGGKDAVYVCDDVDIAQAAGATADGAFYNAGQSCCAIERLYVHQRIYEPFIQAFLGEVARMRLGDPRAADTYLGPLAFSEHLPVLERQIADAVAKGAVIACGGRRVEGPGAFFQPTVLLGVTSQMAVMREETFGPVIGVQAVADDAQALSSINDSTYGLTAGVYSRDRARALAILRHADCGSVYWNCCDRVSPRLPWSGRRQSGLGATLGEAGILAMVQPKAYHLRA